MIRIAIVEDEQAVADQLNQYIARYMGENDFDYKTEYFPSAESFLFGDVNSFDIILLDIQLAGMDGMAAAREVRKVNEQVVVMFVTSLAQYALKGYEVGALDFIVKPVTYYGFTLKFRRAVNIVARDAEQKIVIRNKTQVNILSVHDVYYVDINAHTVIFHTRQGEFSTTGTMKKFNEQLAGCHFVLCNQCYLVNLRYVTGVDGQTVTVAGEKLFISRARKKEFMHALNAYLAGHSGRG